MSTAAQGHQFSPERPSTEAIRARLARECPDALIPETGLTCPECGVVKDTPTALGGHRHKAHGVKGYRVTGAPDRQKKRCRAKKERKMP